MTPTTSMKTVCGVIAVRLFGSVGRNMRRPTGSCPGQNRRASRSSTMTTRGWLVPNADCGAPGSATSRSPKKRPETSRTPIASKNPGEMLA